MTRRRRAPIGLIIAAIFLLTAGGYVWWERWLTHAMTTPVDVLDDARKSFTVEPGQTAGEIAARLEVRDLIRSSLAFTWSVSTRNLDAAFQQGTYDLARSMPADEILRILTSKSTVVRVTLPEGLRAVEIAERLAAANVATLDDLRACIQTCTYPSVALEARPAGASLEGYLFPDTYEFRTGGTAHDALELLVETFGRRIDAQLRADIAASGHTLHDVLTVASMVEEEVATPKDRRMVAGIMWARLDAGISLGIDATVLYALQKHGTDITAEDLRTDSPYNTRLHRGLPPGPIANPGLDAIDATVHPSTSEYLFYLTDAEGVTHYARTNAEHEANKARYLR